MWILVLGEGLTDPDFSSPSEALVSGVFFDSRSAIVATDKTTDLLDENEENDAIQVVRPVFRDYGGRKRFSGPIETVRVNEDNVLVRSTLEGPGEGRVLVVDGGGSTWCALIGDMVAQIAADNGWSGIIVNGCIRDAVDIAKIDVGLKALATCPRRSRKEGKGVVGVAVSFASTTFRPGDYAYADEDGIVVSPDALL